MPPTLDLAGIAALITAIAGLPGALAAWHSKRTRDKLETELAPDHGHSLKDQIGLIRDMISSQGHQIGEIRSDMAADRRRYEDALARHDKEIGALEDDVRTVKLLS